MTSELVFVPQLWKILPSEGVLKGKPLSGHPTLSPRYFSTHETKAHTLHKNMQRNTKWEGVTLIPAVYIYPKIMELISMKLSIGI
jgi:hypothetical protein